MSYTLFNLYLASSKMKLANGLVQVLNGKMYPQQLLYNICYDEIVKHIIFG